MELIYSAPTEKAGQDALEDFGQKRNDKYPMIHASWLTNWGDLSEFFKYPKEIRRAIYMTNAVESLNFQLRLIYGNFGLSKKLKLLVQPLQFHTVSLKQYETAAINQVSKVNLYTFWTALGSHISILILYLWKVRFLQN